jgi:hypothetical protein
MIMGESTTRFAQVIVEAALRIWADLPRDSQEHLFDTATGSDDHLRHQLALYLHDHHPRTAHPPKPTALA